MLRGGRGGPRSSASPRNRRVGRAKTSFLHHRAELPRRELVLAESQLLALALLTRGRCQDELEDALAHFLVRGAAFGDRAAVDVHVVAHGLEGRRGGCGLW